jgi:UPF0716 family protein affecting phage T7 exclusion
MRVFSLFLVLVLFVMFLWVAAEISAFFYVADYLGFGGAVLLSLATSYAGVCLLRRVGVAARQSLFDVLRRSESGFFNIQDGLRGGALSALSAALLIVPGFLSDALGLIFASVSSGFWLRTPLQEQREAKPGDPSVIDLSPRDWHHLDSTGNMPESGRS